MNFDKSFNETIDQRYVVDINGTSEGTQRKYFKDDYWYKEDREGHEGLAEYLISNFLSFTDLAQDEYVLYEHGFINGRSGCRSKNFLQDGENFITFYRLYFSEFGMNMAEVLVKLPNMEERIKYTIDIIFELSGIDVTDYLRKTFTLDLITLNEDRHLNNLGLIGVEDHFSQAPIFDNGKSLLTANVSVNWYFPIEDNVKRVIARPFAGSHRKMFDYFGKGFNVNWDAFIAWLSKQPDSKEKEVFMYQAEFYRKEF